MKWRIAALCLAVLSLGLGLWGLGETRARQAVENELHARYLQSFYETVGHAEDVEVHLSKALAAASPRQLASVFAALRASALAAQSELTRLPLLQGSIMQTSKFMTQVSDFGSTLAGKAGAGTLPSDDDIQLLRRMRAEAAHFSDSLHQIHREVAAGQAPWNEIRRRADRARLSARSDPDGERNQDQGGFTILEEHFEQIPVIHYDGPFSDDVLTRSPKGLTGDEISEERALDIAMDFAPIRSKERYTAEVTRKIDGPVPAYHVAIRQKDEDATDGDGLLSAMMMDVTIKGGHIPWMMANRRIDERGVTVEEAIERGRQFLRELGLENMVPTFVARAGGSAVIPYIPLVDGVRVYPDMVKVSVALDNGDIVGYESMGYLASHTERTMPPAAISGRAAADRISSHVAVDGDPRLALIPLPSGQEVLTWEVKVRSDSDDETYLVYINAVTGEEENILRLVKTAEGDMVL